MTVIYHIFQGSLHDSAEERLRKTESEKDSLSLHVSVLTDQIDAQSEKIRDLEYSLAERHDKVINTEDMLQSVSKIKLMLMLYKSTVNSEIIAIQCMFLLLQKKRSKSYNRNNLNSQFEIFQMNKTGFVPISQKLKLCLSLK